MEEEFGGVWVAHISSTQAAAMRFGSSRFAVIHLALGISVSDIDAIGRKELQAVTDESA